MFAKKSSKDPAAKIADTSVLDLVTPREAGIA
jgi:hypothetical protein